MRPWNDTRYHAVNPIQLAAQTGITRVGTPRLYLPTVSQPHLLTMQLRGYCNGNCHNHQLGQFEFGFSDMTSGDWVQAANQFNPEPISRTAIQFADRIAQWFGIGSGRREADAIVPTQNEVHYNVLAPIAEAVNAPYASALTRGQLQTMLDALLVTKENWLDFLHNTQWSDGRAAIQAENDLAFLFDDQERKLRALMARAPLVSLIPPATPPVTPLDPVVPGGSSYTPRFPLPTYPNYPTYPGGDYVEPETAGASSLLPIAIGLGAVALFVMKGRRRG